ncbi:MAG: radical SAM protein [Rhodospirillales bacterium]|nr:radical SAM protein [Rhodospirillales bacterium]
MPDDLALAPRLDPLKFNHPQVTADGAIRAHVDLGRLDTLWFNTGSLCNIACVNCYMDSSPANDRLAYLKAAEIGAYLDENDAEDLDIREIGFTGGEPFMNPDITAMLKLCLERGFEVLVLTNAMKPMHHHKDALLGLAAGFGARLRLRVSVDHHTKARHEELRGPKSWAPMIEGLKWLADNGFQVAAAGRMRWNEDEGCARKAYAELFAAHGIDIDAGDAVQLVLFPEMDEAADVPEITTACWDILGVAPGAMMCATSRMVIKRSGASAPVVVPCTLLPYDTRFEMGSGLVSSVGPVPLNHPHCARFCVLGGGACSSAN